MTDTDDQWAPITDADLEEPQEAPPPPKQAALVTFPVFVPAPRLLPIAGPPEPEPEPEPLPEPEPPQSGRVPMKDWPKCPEPIYSYEDWQIFDKWVHTRGFSIDQAAACAGIRVYDAMLALEQRDPYYYQMAVMIGPQGGYESPSSPRRTGRRGKCMGERGKAKDYARVETRYQARNDGNPRRQSGSRLSEEDARLKFLEILGGSHPEDRCDGSREHNKRLNVVHPATGQAQKQPPIPVHKRATKKTRVKFSASRPARKNTKRVEDPGGSA